jgi:hypothetical protein
MGRSKLARMLKPADAANLKFCASHIETGLDAAAINIMRNKKVARAVDKELRTGT